LDWDVVIVGAGVAGLAAAECLDRAGLRIKCIEARERAGGRILTIHDPLSPVPIELGAEFVHGRPPEIWDLIRRAPLTVYQRSGRLLHVENGRVREDQERHQVIDRIFSDLQSAAKQGKDQSFADFLARSSYPEDDKGWATSYVEGFNAARKEVIGIASLAEDKRAADEIDGDHSFAILNGYDSLVAQLVKGIRDAPDTLLLNRIVERITWEAGSVTVRIRSSVDGSYEDLRARQALITIPLGVLQAEPDQEGAIRFAPEPADILSAARSLQFGHVFRVTLRLEKPFWAEDGSPNLADLLFLFSQERPFPTWWTPAPVWAPTITGWSAGPSADELIGRTKADITAQAIAALERVSGSRIAVRAAYFHDWQSDVLSRGAYSYVPAGCMAARHTLSQPVRDTLYLAGEATETTGHAATVHGAIKSGLRAARQILASRKSDGPLR
jgi:monoamine oxidase